ncbi:MAG: acyl carrier protein [Steroidobacteraceae bacterium]
MVDEALVARIRRILADHARLDTDIGSIALNDDLYQAGMTSHASVNVMLALEDEFNVEFPDHMLKRSAFDSVASISLAIETLTRA